MEINQIPFVTERSHKDIINVGDMEISYSRQFRSDFRGAAAMAGSSRIIGAMDEYKGKILPCFVGQEEETDFDFGYTPGIEVDRERSAYLLTPGYPGADPKDIILERIKHLLETSPKYNDKHGKHELFDLIFTTTWRKSELEKTAEILKADDVGTDTLLFSTLVNTLLGLHRSNIAGIQDGLQMHRITPKGVIPNLEGLRSAFESSTLSQIEAMHTFNEIIGKLDSSYHDKFEVAFGKKAEPMPRRGSKEPAPYLFEMKAINEVLKTISPRFLREHRKTITRFLGDVHNNVIPNLDELTNFDRAIQEMEFKSDFRRIQEEHKLRGLGSDMREGIKGQLGIIEDLCRQ
ncbi:MAG: hypothetical protein FWE31_01180 [Firmicutes bacterium]|nr:hypothetical protein [Bacillota bacterium]